MLSHSGAWEEAQWREGRSRQAGEGGGGDTSERGKGEGGDEQVPQFPRGEAGPGVLVSHVTPSVHPAPTSLVMLLTHVEL